MDGNTVVPLIGCVILVVAGSLRAPAGGAAGVRVTIAAYVAAVVVSASLVGLFIRRAASLPETLPTELLQYGAAQLSRATETNVLVVDGGSYPARGLDERTLTRALAKRGYSVRVVHLAMSAGNHLERYTMYDDMLRRVEPGAHGKRWVLLAEVHMGYDVSPFAQFERNHDTTRAYHYVTPGNAWFGLDAVYFGGGNEVRVPHLGWTVFRHMLVNAFNVGTAPRFFTSEAPVRPHSGYIFGYREGKYVFPGLGPAIQRASAPPGQVEVPSWLFRVRERRLERLWGKRVSGWLYYGLPSTNPGSTEFVRRFCGLTQRPCIAPDAALLRDLDSADKWYNAGHLSGRGAVVYSEWLAARLDEKGVLRK